MICKKILFFLKKNYLMIALAFAVGLISVLPYVLAPFWLGSDYQGIPFIYQANEDAYLARIREVVDGHWAVGSAFFYEYKDWLPMVPSTGEVLYALPTILFHLPILGVLIFSKFLLPAVLFLLVYYFIIQLSHDNNSLSSRLNAIVGGLLVTLGYDLIDYRYIIKLFKDPNIPTVLSVWTRPINPITGAIFIFTFLILVLFIIKKRKKYFFIPAGLIWALTIGYVFSWTFILVILMLLLLLYLYKKDYFLVKNFLFVLLVWLLTTLPYWYGLFSNFLSPEGKETAARSGLVYSHFPVFNKIVFGATIFFLFASFYYIFCKKKKIKDELWWHISSILLLTSWIVLNQQILTGRVIWYHHYVQYTIPALIVVGMLILNNWIKPQLFKIWTILIISVLLSIFGYNILTARTFGNLQNDFRNLQDFAPVFSWINNNAAPDCVILNQDALGVKLDTLVPAFTGCNVYTPSWVFDGVTEERVWHNYLVMLRLRNVDPAEVKDYLYDHSEEVLQYFFVDWDQLFYGTGEEYTEEKIDELTIAYQDFVKTDFSQELKKYKLDYILFVGEADKKIIEQLPQIESVYNSGQYFIYQF